MAVSTEISKASESDENVEKSSPERPDGDARKIDGRLLEAFYKLAEPSDQIRITAVINTITILRGIQIKNSENEVSFELKYTVERLVKGLSSPRKAARFGFSLALVEVLRAFPDVGLEDVVL